MNEDPILNATDSLVQGTLLPAPPSTPPAGDSLMGEIKTLTENLLSMLGLDQSIVALVRHAVLVAVTVLLAWGAYLLGRRVILPVILHLERKTSKQWVKHLFGKDVLASACRILPAIVVWQVLPHVFFEYPVVQEILRRLTAIYITIMVVKTIILFIDKFKLLEDERRTSMQQYFQSFCGVLKIILVFIAFVIVVSILINRSPSNLFITIGSASAILMLVFKDTIEGLVAGIRLTSNNMLHVGDWITVPKANADGIVEEMSLTTVKVRNFDNTIITVSPKTLVEDSFQNWIGMQQSPGRRVSRQIYIDFQSIRPLHADDVEAIQALQPRPSAKTGDVNLTVFRQYVEDYLGQLPEVNQQMTLMVRQLKTTQAGLPLDVYFFLKEKEWVAYEHTTAQIMEHIYATIAAFGLKIYQPYIAPNT